MTKRILIDLFSGAGGFSLGAHQSGFITRLAIDNDKDLVASYPINFPKAKLIIEDISKLDPLDTIHKTGIKLKEIDGILGGPPCQGFSYMGKRNTEDVRNKLLWHFFQFIKACEPKFFIMENVPGLMTNPFIHLLNAGIDLVASRYSIIGPKILNAADFGAATNRYRIFVIGYRNQYINSFTEADINLVKTTSSTVYEAIHDLPPLDTAFQDSSGHFWAKYIPPLNDGMISEYAKRARLYPTDELSTLAIRQKLTEGLVSGFPITRHTPEVIKRFASVQLGKCDKISKCTRLNWNTPCIVLRAGTGKDKGGYQSIRPIHPEENRVISIREAARIQGFPDWFQFHPTKWHSFRMIGNSVSPYIAKAILMVISKNMHYSIPNQITSSPNVG